MTATARYLMPAQHAGGLAPARFELKSVSDDGEFEGYASLFNREDLGHDVIAPGAFYDSLAGRDVNAIKMLFQHNASEPIGVWEVIREDAKGLYVKGRLMTAVAKAREVLALMRAGALDGLSIGFKAVKARRDARSGVRRIEKVDLWEISVVTFPMLPGARVEAVKKRPFVGRAPSERDFERWLTRDAGLSRNEARAVTRQGYSGLKTVRSAGGFAVRIRDASARIENETARLNVPGGLRLSDLKSSALRVEGDVAYVRMLAAIERLKVVTAREEKFNPNHDDAGRFTTADGASSGGSGNETLAGDPGNDQISTESEFSPNKFGWHQYVAGPNIGCAAELKCSNEEMADQLSRFSVPGQNPAAFVEDGKSYDVYDPRTGLYAGKVSVSISEDSLTIINRTLPGHILYKGQIERSATRASDGSWSITTAGTGNNILPGMNAINEWQGPKIFDFLDQRLRENIDRHHGVIKGSGDAETGNNCCSGDLDGDAVVWGGPDAD